MGQVHNELRKSILGAALKAALGVDDAESMLERFGETLTPTINLWDLPEWAFLRDEVLLATVTVAGPIAAELSFVALVNPVGSKQILTIEKIRFLAGVAMSVNFAYGLAGPIIATGSSAVCFNRDPRNVPPSATPGQGASSQIQLVSGTDPAFANFLTTTLETSNADTANIDHDAMCVPVIVPPGVGYAAIGNTVNQSLRVNFVARVRNALPAELG